MITKFLQRLAKGKWCRLIYAIFILQYVIITPLIVVLAYSLAIITAVKEAFDNNSLAMFVSEYKQARKKFDMRYYYFCLFNFSWCGIVHGMKYDAALLSGKVDYQNVILYRLQKRPDEVVKI